MFPSRQNRVSFQSEMTDIAVSFIFSYSVRELPHAWSEVENSFLKVYAVRIIVSIIRLFTPFIICPPLKYKKIYVGLKKIMDKITAGYTSSRIKNVEHTVENSVERVENPK